MSSLLFLAFASALPHTPKNVRLEPAVAFPKRAVICPGGAAACPSGNTCCLMDDGTYGCCPIANAVCCADHVHCCAKDQECVPSQGVCRNKWGEETPAFKRTPAIPIPRPPPHHSLASAMGGVINCPDGSSCEDSETCCEAADGSYGCCPDRDAVCCADQIHCCPHGDICDNGCVSPAGAVSQLIRLHLTSVPQGDDTGAGAAVAAVDVGRTVDCPDGSTCASGSTCCPDGEGGYGCCPISGAVCCADNVHCCPAGYTCDNGCVASVAFLNLIPPTSAKSVSGAAGGSGSAEALGNVDCADGSTCPSGSTCCSDGEGGYGCCPYVDAVCCSDHVHCCPRDNTCDNGCVSPAGQVAILQNMIVSSPPIPSLGRGGVVCPGNVYECPSGHTCCKMTDGAYGCCQYPNATCCSDNQHCCPQGNTCDVTTATCNAPGLPPVPWSPKVAAIKAAP